MRKLAGRSAIVTGASEGIGRHVARALAKEGMNLALAARLEAKLQSLAGELSALGVRAIAVCTDVTDRQALESLVDRAIQELGAIDVLVNNAGIETFHHFDTLEVDDIVRTIEVNLTAALVLTRLVLPHMLPAGGGHIVNMSSTAGKFGPAFGAAYGASKAGLVAFTESLRSEYHGTGVSASVICPGFANEGGMYERIKEETRRCTPWLVGSTSSQAVAKAVVRALKRDLPEVIVNVPPLRPMTVLAELSPSLSQWIVRWASWQFFKRIAERREEKGVESRG